MKVRINITNTLMYIVGIMFISFSVVLSFKTGFGVTPADNVTGMIALTTGLSLGGAAFLVSSFIIFCIMIFYKSFKFLFLFVQVIMFSPLLDLWNLVVLHNFAPTGFMAVVILIISVFLLPLGGMLMIKSTYPAGLYDELMFLTYRVTKFKLNVSRTFNELVLILIALIISLLTKNGIGFVNFGTFIYALSVGNILKFYIFGIDKIIETRRKINDA